MNILEHIKQELPWFDANSTYDLTRGKPAPEQLDIVQNILAKNATAKDEGTWELLVGSGKDLDTFEKKSIFYKIIVKGM